MENDEFYSGVAKPEFYRLFHELVSLPNVREFFSWDQTNAEFTNEEKARQLYELIEPIEEESVSKLTTFRDVRNLRYIIGNRSAEAILLDPEQTFAAALNASKPEPDWPVPSILPDRIREFLKTFETAGFEEIVALDDDDINLLEQLADLIASRIEDHNKLSA